MKEIIEERIKSPIENIRSIIDNYV